MTRRVVVLGAGGFTRNVLDVLDAANAAGARVDVLGLLDRSFRLSPALVRRGCRLLGDDAVLEHLDTDYLIGIADPRIRRRLDEYGTGLGRSAALAVHPAATVSTWTQLGAGTVVTAGARLASDIVAGRHLHANLNVTIGHDARLGDYVTLHPQAAISGNTVLEDGVTVGSGAVVLPGIRIGAEATVGAGAVVCEDVDPGTTVVGVPARAVIPPPDRSRRK